MVEERWEGVFTVEYDEVDIDQLVMECGMEPDTYRFRTLIIKEANRRAHKACPGLRIETITVEKNHAKITYAARGTAGVRTGGLWETARMGSPDKDAACSR